MDMGSEVDLPAELHDWSKFGQDDGESGWFPPARSEPVTTNLRLTCRQGRDEKSVTILSAVRSANADSVSVGLAVPTVGDVPLPTR
jgi:hypothetical protein